MNLKVKFAVLFSVFVFVILFTSVAIIYELYDNNRREDFNVRLHAYAVQAYENKLNLPFPGKTKGDSPERAFTFLKMSSPVVVILDKSYQIVAQSPDNIPYTIDYDLINKVKKYKQFYFDQDVAEGVGLSVKNNKQEYIVIATAIDVIGLDKLRKLRVIIAIVMAIGILLTSIFGFLYMYILTKPLEKLGVQMQRITENNLRERVAIKKDNEFFGIASNFNDMLDRLQKGFEFQKSFVDHASHELRTPLAVMLAQTESALRRNISGDEIYKLLTSLREDQQDMIELTNSLLLLSQYEKLIYSTDWPRLRIDEVLYETVTSTKRMLEDIKVFIEFGEMTGEMNLSIHGNESLLRSAFRNLIKNAFTYSDNQTVRIIIESINGRIKINFFNTGKVLEPSEQEKLFIPFFRGLNSQQKREFGLGLSIVTRIITLHKGTISYEAVNNNENKFTVAFDSITE